MPYILYTLGAAAQVNYTPILYTSRDMGVMVLKHTPLGKIKLKGCKQHSSGELKFSSSQPMLIPHWRRKQR